MSQTVITLAFEQYKAQQEAIAAPIALDEFVLANVPNQDASRPIDRNEGLPPQAQIVFVSDVSQAGYVNPNSVVYTLLMDTTIGDFDFNWIGLRNKASGVIGAISHIPTVYKLKTMLGVKNGNSVTRSIMMSYSDAMGLTHIDVDASTWQIDFTARLFGIDEAERLGNLDVFGQAAFLTNGFKVEKSGSAYIAKAGRGYVGGLRCDLTADLTLKNVINSGGIYLDASWQGLLTSEWQTVFDIKASNTPLVDYVDGNGYQHYVTKIANVDANGHVIDVRHVEGFREYYQQAAVDDLLNKKVDKASITSSVASASSVLVASAKGLKTAYDKAVSAYNLANAKWTHRAASTSQTGTCQLSDSVTSSSSVLSATAKAVKAAYDKAVSAYNLASGKWSYVVATTSVYGATKLSTSISSSSTALAATASAVKAAYDLANGKWTHRSASTSQTGTCQLSDSVTSTSSVLAGTSKSVKAAYDKGVEALNKAAYGVPVGVPLPWPSLTIPLGFLECRGQSFNKATFPELAKAYPNGIIKDLRGDFIRGWDNDRGIDIGRKILSTQGDAIRNITGSVLSFYAPLNSFSGNGAMRIGAYGSSPAKVGVIGGDPGANYSISFDASNQVPTAADNRPKNTAFMYIVRAA